MGFRVSSLSILLITSFAVSMSGQDSRGSIQGTVTDAGGSLISAVNVRAVSSTCRFFSTTVRHRESGKSKCGSNQWSIRADYWTGSSKELAVRFESEFLGREFNRKISRNHQSIQILIT